MNTALYEADFYEWALQQADLLRNEDYAQLDIPHLVEEIEAMAKQNRRELFSRLQVILLHLLKWRYQPTRRSPSWRTTLTVQRDEIALLLADSPSLRRELPDMVVKAYPKACANAADETRLPLTAFPARCEWGIEQILERYLP